MAIRNIVTIGNDVLREKCREVTSFDARLGILIDDMIDTMFKAEGVGLAAPQVGILKRVAVVSVNGEKIYELVNPVITSASGKQIGEEGCLSIPKKFGLVERPNKITVEYQDRNGVKKTIKATGFLARAFCHEIDHLDGIMYVDKVIAEV